ncbi:methyltransferase [Actinopolyspora mortivallis]|nr:methyltransferase [Actinopolyspora mortivallis]
MDGGTAGRTLMGMADLLRPSAVRAAATLRLADHVAASSGNLEEMAERTGTRPELLDVLLRYLVDIGLFRRDASGQYGITDLGTPLLENSPESVRRHLSVDGLFGRADAALIGLTHTIRTGEPCHVATFGHGYWEAVNESPEFAEALQHADESGLSWDMETILESYNWSDVDSVVDVGGHNGTLLAELALRNPGLRGTLVDLTNVVEVARRKFSAQRLDDRCEAVVGSFFEPLPTGADVYLLSAILADWSDEQAVEILRRCAEAANPHGRVLLAEVNMPMHDAYLELWIRATMPAPVREVSELVALAERAGLRLTWEGPVTQVRSMLEFAPTTP